jgi:hypothetical protein
VDRADEAEEGASLGRTIRRLNMRERLSGQAPINVASPVSVTVNGATAGSETGCLHWVDLKEFAALSAITARRSALAIRSRRSALASSLRYRASSASSVSSSARSVSFSWLAFGGERDKGPRFALQKVSKAENRAVLVLDVMPCGHGNAPVAQGLAGSEKPVAGVDLASEFLAQGVERLA